MRRFVLNLALYYFVLVFSSPFSIAVTSLGVERANLSAFHTFVWFALVWFCLFSLPLGVWEGLRLMIVALSGRFSYLFFLVVCSFFRWSVLLWSRSVSLTYLCRMDSSALTLGLELHPFFSIRSFHSLHTDSFPVGACLINFLILSCFKEIPTFNANRRPW